jgi:hypothetical protein
MQVLNATENLAPSSTAAEPPAKQARLVTAAAAAAAGDAAMAAAEEETFRVQRISERAVLPARGSAKAAGYDIARYVLGFGGGVEGERKAMGFDSRV